LLGFDFFKVFIYIFKDYFNLINIIFSIIALKYKLFLTHFILYKQIVKGRNHTDDRKQPFSKENNYFLEKAYIFLLREYMNNNWPKVKIFKVIVKIII